jgi:hypothetical protein
MQKPWTSSVAAPTSKPRASRHALRSGPKLPLQILQLPKQYSSGRSPIGRIGPAPRDAGPSSEPDVRLSPHPAQATSAESGNPNTYDPSIEMGGSSAGPLTPTVGRGV